jgi:hypothetical protein
MSSFIVAEPPRGDQRLALSEAAEPRKSGKSRLE